MVGAVVLAGVSSISIAARRDYTFDGKISRTVLENYLSRAVTHVGLCSTSADPSTAVFDDDLRMLTDIGAKFVGRAAYAWILPKDEDSHFKQVKVRAAKVHQAGVFNPDAWEIEIDPKLAAMRARQKKDR